MIICFKFLFVLFQSVYKDGKVCISILHAPGEDPNQYESSSERWSPVQSIEKILLSVISMLAEPNVKKNLKKKKKLKKKTIKKKLLKKFFF